MPIQSALNQQVASAVSALEDVKAKDIAILDTSAQTSLFNRMIIATGDSSRQVKALAGRVLEEWKNAGIEILGSEGLEGGEWALVDAGDVVVHVMLPATRDYYDIDGLWGGQKPASDADWRKQA